MMTTELLYVVGFALIFFGILIVAILVLVKSARAVKGKFKGAGAIFIGPVPIVFGTDKKSVKTVLVLAIVLMALVLAVMVVNYLLAG